MARIEIPIDDDALWGLSREVFTSDETKKLEDEIAALLSRPQPDGPQSPPAPRTVANNRWPEAGLGRVYQTVARPKGLSIVIWADEHPPPHFHVVFQGEEASFSEQPFPTCTRARVMGYYSSDSNDSPHAWSLLL